MALGLICLLFLSASVGADWLDGDQDVDRPYGDLAGMPVSLAANAAPRECALRCQANSSCVAWAYCSAASVGAPTPVCYLKETVEPQKYSPGKVYIGRSNLRQQMFSKLQPESKSQYTHVGLSTAVF